MENKENEINKDYVPTELDRKKEDLYLLLHKFLTEGVIVGNRESVGGAETYVVKHESFWNPVVFSLTDDRVSGIETNDVSMTKETLIYSMGTERYLELGGLLNKIKPDYFYTKQLDNFLGAFRVKQG